MLSYLFVVRLGSKPPVSDEVYISNIISALSLDVNSATKIVFRTDRTIDETGALIQLTSLGVSEKLPKEVLNKAIVQDFHDQWGCKGKLLKIEEYNIQEQGEEDKKEGKNACNKRMLYAGVISLILSIIGPVLAVTYKLGLVGVFAFIILLSLGFRLILISFDFEDESCEKSERNKSGKKECIKLISAIKSGKIKKVEKLLENNCDANTRSFMFRVPSIFIATKKGEIEIIKMLIKAGALIDSEKMKKITSLHYVVKKGNTNIADLLLKNGANIQKSGSWGTPLCIATKKVNLNMIKFLLNNGANVNIMNEQGLSPLHIAVKKNNFELVDFFLDNGADINLKDNRKKTVGNTPLHIAASEMNMEIYHYLLKKGADGNIRDNGEYWSGYLRGKERGWITLK